MDFVEVDCSLSEMEKTTTRRDCIANIINILHVSTESETKEHLKQMKKDLEFEMTYSSTVVIQKLKGILKTLNKEIKNLHRKGLSKKTKSKVVTVPEKKYKMKRVDVRLVNVSTIYIQSILQTDPKKVESKSEKEKKKMLAEQEKQMEKMRNLPIQQEEEVVPLISKSHFLAALGLYPKSQVDQSGSNSGRNFKRKRTSPGQCIF